MINTTWFPGRPSFFPFILLVSLFLFDTCRASPRSSYALFHRLGPSPSSNNHNSTLFEWQKRAVLDVSFTGSSLDNTPGSDNFHFVVSSFTKSTEPLKIPSSVPMGSLDYQIGLLPQDSQELLGEFGHPDTGFAISSYPLCTFLADPSSSTQGTLSEYLNIWIKPMAISSSNPESQPSSIHNLQLELLGIQWSTSSPTSPYSPLSTSRTSSCDDLSDQRDASISNPSHQIKAQLENFITNHGKSSIKISVRKPEKLIDPVLKPYPIHKTAEYFPDGRMKEPGPEKSFLAKYWIYILPVVVLLVMGGGPSDENAPAGQPQPPERPS